MILHITGSEVFSGASILIAAVSARNSWISGRSSRKSSEQAEKSANIAKLQAQLNYQQAVSAMRPGVYVELDDVYPRWAARGVNLSDDMGRPSPIMIGRGESKRIVSDEEIITDDLLNEEDHLVELVISGVIKNTTEVEQMATVRRDGAIKPYENCSLFLIGGTDTQKFLVKPQSETRFTWIDRHSISQWDDYYRVIHGFGSVEVQPSGRIERFKNLLHEARNDELKRRAEDAFKREFDFDLVFETRAQQRLAVVWRIIPKSYVVEPANGGRKLGPHVSGQIDDEVVFYRYSFDSSLARLYAGEMVFLPGRS